MTSNLSAQAELLKPAEAAALLGDLSVRTLEDWRTDGKGPRFVRIREKGYRTVVRYPHSDLVRWMAENCIGLADSDGTAA